MAKLSPQSFEIWNISKKAQQVFFKNSHKAGLKHAEDAEIFVVWKWSTDHNFAEVTLETMSY